MTVWDEIKTRRNGILAGAVVGLAITLYVHLQGLPLEFAVQSSGLVDSLFSTGTSLTTIALTKVGIAFVTIGALFGYLIDGMLNG